VIGVRDRVAMFSEWEFWDDDEGGFGTGSGGGQRDAYGG
jgi:hypothetical protein